MNTGWDITKHVLLCKVIWEITRKYVEPVLLEAILFLVRLGFTNQVLLDLVAIPSRHASPIISHPYRKTWLNNIWFGGIAGFYIYAKTVFRANHSCLTFPIPNVLKRIAVNKNAYGPSLLNMHMDVNIMFRLTHHHTKDLSEAMQKRMQEQEEVLKAGTDLVEALQQIKTENDFTFFLRQLNDVSRGDISEKQMTAACAKVVSALQAMEWGDIGQSKNYFSLVGDALFLASDFFLAIY